MSGLNSVHLIVTFLQFSDFINLCLSLLLLVLQVQLRLGVSGSFSSSSSYSIPSRVLCWVVETQLVLQLVWPLDRLLILRREYPRRPFWILLSLYKAEYTKVVNKFYTPCCGEKLDSCFLIKYLAITLSVWGPFFSFSFYHFAGATGFFSC